MNEELAADAATSSAQSNSNRDITEELPPPLIEQFIVDVENGDFRRLLAEDCILYFFSRNIKGVVPASGYIRVQLRGRFRHSGFEITRRCEESRVNFIKERYEQSFNKLRRQLAKTSSEQKETVTSLHLAAESDEDEESSGNPARLFTPPRVAAAQSQNLLQYIEATGVLEPIATDDGGIDIGSSRNVLLTLGYRSIPDLSEGTQEICLIMYEPQDAVYAASTSQQRQRQPRRLAFNAHSDDEDEHTESPAAASPSQSVRRALFSSSSSTRPQHKGSATPRRSASLALSPPTMLSPPSLTASLTRCTNESGVTAITPRKRQHHEISSNSAGKRSAGRTGMRF